MPVPPDDRPVIGKPTRLLTLEELNYMVSALLLVGTRRLGSEYGRDVLATATDMERQRSAARAFHDEPRVGYDPPAND